MNKTTLIGHIGKDPEQFTFDNGNVKTTFSLATTESYKDKNGEWKEITDWHNIAIPREYKHLKKGDMVVVEGKNKTRKYEDKDGNTRYVHEVVCLYVKRLRKKHSAQTESDSSDLPSDNIPDDDLPF